MVLRGKHYDAATMRDYGFVHELVDDESFETALEEIVEEYLNRPPIAMELRNKRSTAGSRLLWRLDSRWNRSLPVSSSVPTTRRRDSRRFARIGIPSLGASKTDR